jgi:hypothetical protein
MRNSALVNLFFALSTISLAQQPSVPNQSTRQNGVPERGDHVMGFSHDATTHHFHLLKDGGEIVVTANDPNDKGSIDQIRTHLNHIVGMFSNGNFDAPMLIHDTNPPGVATMKRLKSEIRYSVSDLPYGAMIRIQTSNPETTDAVHAFLLFQIVDHKTGDTPTIGG